MRIVFIIRLERLQLRGFLRRTIFSGERGLNEIMELDEAMGSRIYQRCGKYKLKIGWGEGRNYRTREEGVV